MSTVRLHILLAAMSIAALSSACSSRVEARAELRQPPPAITASAFASDAALAPRAPFDERPVTPFETVGAACSRTQC